MSDNLISHCVNFLCVKSHDTLDDICVLTMWVLVVPLFIGISCKLLPVSWFSEKLIEENNKIFNMYKYPKEENREKFLKHISSFILVTGNLSERYRTGEEVFTDCKPMQMKCWVDYMLNDITHDKLQEFKNIYKWSDDNYKQFKLLLKNSEAAWMALLDWCYGYLEKDGMLDFSSISKHKIDSSDESYSNSSSSSSSSHISTL